MKITLALAALGTISAIEIDPFHIKNFMKLDVAKTMLATMAQNNDRNDIGKVCWSQCDDANKDFHFNESMTSYNTNPVTKGKQLALNLGGILDFPEQIEKIHVHVNWNGAALYDEDVAVGETFDSVVKKTISWIVPAYAPSGKYEVNLTGTDKSKKTDLCMNAVMYL